MGNIERLIHFSLSITDSDQSEFIFLENGSWLKCKSNWALIKNSGRICNKLTKMLLNDPITIYIYQCKDLLKNIAVSIENCCVATLISDLELCEHCCKSIRLQDVQKFFYDNYLDNWWRIATSKLPENQNRAYNFMYFLSLINIRVMSCVYHKHITAHSYFMNFIKI